jgi:peptidoglycan hydrolase-like protein with peptidoglycan-binding domain
MIQKALKKLGYFHYWASGKFGDNLKRSVIKYHKSNNFKVTSTVSKSLYDKIIQQYKDTLEEEQIELK